MKPHFKSILNLFTFVALLASLLMATPAAPVRAASFFPITAAQLISDISTANTNNADDTITLGANITLTLADNGSNGLPVILSDTSHALTIEGAGFTLSRSSAGGTPNFRVFEVDTGADLTLNNITISNGNPSSNDGGGAVLNNGVLTITNSTISGNTALTNTTGGAGGAIESNDTLTIQNSTISGNSAISNNLPSAYGGAIYSSGQANIENSTFSGNSATSVSGSGAIGGAIFTNTSGTLTIVNSTFYDNHAVDSTGGGSGGAILNNNSTVTIQNSTFSGNSASNAGGGIDNSGTLNLENTILANNTTDTGNDDCYNYGGDTIATNINNLIENNGVSGNMCGTPSVTADPMLGPLANNGGSTQTMALLFGSPAIDAGNPIYCTAGSDQRGVSYVGPCDIGAFESALTISRSDSTKDGWLEETTEFSNMGGAPHVSLPWYIRAGDSSANHQYRGFMNFNTGSLPDNATITKLIFRIKKIQVVGSPFSGHGKLFVDMRKGFFGTSAKLQSLDFNALSSKDNVGGLTAVSGGWYQLTISAANYPYLNLKGTTQFRLHFAIDDDNDHIGDFVRFFSGDSSSADQPQLLIGYTVP